MRKPFDLFMELENSALSERYCCDPATSSAFVGHVNEGVKRALDDLVLLYGQRTEAMFEALLVCLGGFELLKTEENGDMFPDHRYLAPDFRIVLNDGGHWLIEAKRGLIL